MKSVIDPFWSHSQKISKNYSFPLVKCVDTRSRIILVFVFSRYSLIATPILMVLTIYCVDRAVNANVSVAEAGSVARQVVR